MKTRRNFYLASLLLSIAFVSIRAQQPDPPGQVARGEEAVNEAYLFAHMMHNDYGKLYYTVSLDGLHWKTLNQGGRVFDAYRGHPDICKGHDGRYYLAGNPEGDAPVINIWVSSDLINWEHFLEYTPALKQTPGYSQALPRIGAPKLFYDEASSEYLLTWHTPHMKGTKEDPERYWASQRTLYVTSADFDFPEIPHRLFDWEMGTIDVIIRKANDRYYAIIKDEKYPTLDWVSGKTIRISSSDSLLGPYSYPSDPVSPNFREAPMIIPSPDGKACYLYYEQYPGVSYGLSVASDLDGPWYQVSGYTFYSSWDKYTMPPSVRHGCMITISREEHDLLVEHFNKESTSSFQNPILIEGADPYVYLHEDGYYYSMVTRGDRLQIWKSKPFTNFADAETKTIWYPPDSGGNSCCIWAPEIHYFNGSWYIYYTGADKDNPVDNSRGIFVLRNSSANPFDGSWEDLGQVETDFPGIDGHVFEYQGTWYFAYSPYIGKQSGINLARLISPTRIEQEINLGLPMYEWEKTPPREIMEGPQFLAGPKDKVFIIYSAGACWDDNYGLGLFAARKGADLLDPASWERSSSQVFGQNPDSSVFGPGHNCFTKSPDGTEDWIVYHGKSFSSDECAKRSARAQKFSWDEEGMPLFGKPVSTSTKLLNPSGIY